MIPILASCALADTLAPRNPRWSLVDLRSSIISSGNRNGNEEAAGSSKGRQLAYGRFPNANRLRSMTTRGERQGSRFALPSRGSACSAPTGPYLGLSGEAIRVFKQACGKSAKYDAGHVSDISHSTCLGRRYRSQIDKLREKPKTD
jgi:hypothetical protein